MSIEWKLNYNVAYKMIADGKVEECVKFNCLRCNKLFAYYG